MSVPSSQITTGVSIHELGALSSTSPVTANDEFAIYHSSTGNDDLTRTVKAPFSKILDKIGITSDESGNLKAAYKNAQMISIKPLTTIGSSSAFSPGFVLPITLGGTGSSTRNFLKNTTDTFFGRLTITSDADTTLKIQSPSGNTEVARIQIKSDAGNLGLYSNPETHLMGIYDYTNARRIIAKDAAAAGTVQGAATTFYGLATSAQALAKILPISEGGTGATTKERAVHNLFSSNISNASFLLGVTSDWSASGSISFANIKTALSIPSLSYSQNVPSSSACPTVNSGTASTVLKVTLTKGYHIIHYGASFGSNGSGYRLIYLTDSTNISTFPRTATSCAATSGSPGISLTQTRVVNVTANSQSWYLWVKHNAGQALTVYPYVCDLKISV